MKKVLAIAPYPYLPYFSGGQKYIAQFLEHLGRERDLTVISTPDNDATLAKTYQLVPLLKKSFSRYYDTSLVKKISHLVRDGGFDTVIWEHPYYAWLARRVRRRTGTSMVIHTHNIEYQRFRSTGRWWWPILQFYEKKAFKAADALLFITEEDKRFAVKEWAIAEHKCIPLPFGVEARQFPADREEYHARIAAQYGFDPSAVIIQFNGLLNYQPNLDALWVILDRINPLLQARAGFNYRILICGKGLPEELDSLQYYADKNIIYTGFVPDIDTYLKATDIFLNPVQSGGGIKTKMVEAIAWGATVISTQTGATGMEKEICGGKLALVPDNDWEGMAAAIIAHAKSDLQTPAAYYAHYNWEQIVRNAVSRIGAI